VSGRRSSWFKPAGCWLCMGVVVVRRADGCCPNLIDSDSLPSLQDVNRELSILPPKPRIPILSLSISLPILLVPTNRDLEWTVNKGEARAVVPSLRGGAGKSALFQVCRPLFPLNLKLTNQTNQKTLLGDNRISPPSLSNPLPLP